MNALPRAMPAIITPFDDRQELDLDAHRHNVAFLGELGYEGFVLAGSTGEGPLLEPGERRRLAAASREAGRDDAFLLCGINAETNRIAASQIAEAADGGADAVLVLTPTTLSRNRTNFQTAFFREVAEESPLPVFLYSVPIVTAYSLPLETVWELAQHPNVVGMKDSSGDTIRVQRMLAQLPDDFALYNGAAPAVTLSLAAGAHGAILAAVNYVPRLSLEVVTAALESPPGNMGMQHRLTAANDGVARYGIPGVKAAAEIAGLRAGRARAPLLSVTEEARAEVARILER
ncbi:MAG: dihydrodipicolinate synthase family protein [bacterium]|nr:dihydrodipicolinate synthase family protein [bacterium]MDE0287456.1 dihydrodipicolinate synthase family protein [bacterium]MDE0436847.1 dihydrodipicolinate synthase family protein [bacterium]